MKPISLLTSSMGKELQHSIMSVFWGYGDQFREREVERDRADIFTKSLQYIHF